MKALLFEIRMRPRMVRYNGDENCSICLEPLKKARYVKQLPCEHLFINRALQNGIRRKPVRFVKTYKIP